MSITPVKFIDWFIQEDTRIVHESSNPFSSNTSSLTTWKEDDYRAIRVETPSLRRHASLDPVNFTSEVSEKENDSRIGVDRLRRCPGNDNLAEEIKTSQG